MILVKITSEAIISKKSAYFRKNCEDYAIECSQQLYKNCQ